MATLTKIVSAINKIVDDMAYTDDMVIDLINNALLNIAAGIRMPDGHITNPLPELYTYSTVASGSLQYVALPTDYHRLVFNILDETLYTIPPVQGGDYYSFKLFLKTLTYADMSEVGSIHHVCIKGSKLYYQGIPNSPTILGLHYYKKPDILSLDGDEPSCLPGHLQLDLLKHYVCKEIYGEKLEDGVDNAGVGVKYHTNKFFESMTNLIDFIGIDSGPTYYGSDGFVDMGVCDG